MKLLNEEKFELIFNKYQIKQHDRNAIYDLIDKYYQQPVDKPADKAKAKTWRIAKMLLLKKILDAIEGLCT